MDRIEDHAYKVVIEERIRTLWRYRAWYRANVFADWTEVRKLHDEELHALVKLARQARRISRATHRRNADELALGDHYAYPDIVA